MEYDIEIRHLPGKSNGRADVLSRRPDYDTGTKDNENIVVLPEHVFVCAMKVLGVTPSQDETTLQPWVDPHNLKKVNNKWYKDGHLVITGGLKDKQSIICRHHDVPVYGHPGINKTTQLME